MRFLEENLANGFKTFAIGKARHGIMVNEDGNLMSDGLLLRTGEDEYITYWLAPYLQYKQNIKEGAPIFVNRRM